MRAVAGILTAGLVLGGSSVAWADGTETLGPPTVPIAEGTGIAVGGVGLFRQPGTIELSVPADAVVEQVLLYYEAGHRPGDTSGELPDETVLLDGTEVTATRIGGPTHFYGDVQTATHRADVTDLGLVGPGQSSIVVDGLDDDEVRDGAGLVVIYSQPGERAQLSLFDGNDIAFVDFAPPRDATVPQTFTFDAADTDRVAELAVLTTSVHDPAPQPNPSGDQKNRPNDLKLTTGGVTTVLHDPLGDAEPEWDSGVLEVTIPAGATTLTVEYVSARDDTGDLPASLVWLAAGLSVPVPAPVPTPPPAVAAEAPVAETTTTTVPAEVLAAGAERTIPRTGGSSSDMLLGALAAVLGGSGLLLLGRRRMVGSAAR